MAAAKVAQQIENSPLPTVVQNLASSIADAQLALDRKTIEALRVMADADEHGITLPGEDEPYSMLELGFTPAFLAFTEATIETRFACSMMEGDESTIGFSATVGAEIKVVSVAVSLNASYTRKHSFQAEASSSVVAKIVSVPPPAVLGDVINDLRARRAA